jgi:hypothetical protein
LIPSRASRLLRAILRLTTAQRQRESMVLVPLREVKNDLQGERPLYFPADFGSVPGAQSTSSRHARISVAGLTEVLGGRPGRPGDVPQPGERLLRPTGQSPGPARPHHAYRPRRDDLGRRVRPGERGPGSTTIPTATSSGPRSSRLRPQPRLRGSRKNRIWHDPRHRAGLSERRVYLL